MTAEPGGAVGISRFVGDSFGAELVCGALGAPGAVGGAEGAAGGPRAGRAAAAH